MSRNLFALSFTGFVAAGIMFAAAMSRVSLHWTWMTSGWKLIVACVAVFLISIMGTLIYEESDVPIISALGYALVAGPFGLLLGPVINQYTPTSVLRAFALTTVVVLILGFIGAVIPDNLESWRTWLMGGLIVLIVGYGFMPVIHLLGFNVGGALTVWDWASIILFSGLTVYDVNKAMQLPRTLDNAIDAAGAVFMDYINMFIHILSLSGQRTTSNA